MALLAEGYETRWLTSFVQVNVSAAVDVVSKMGLWSRFEEGKTLSLAEAVKATGADEIMISMQPHSVHQLVSLLYTRNLANIIPPQQSVSSAS
jgi:hypothetical protein